MRIVVRGAWSVSDARRFRLLRADHVELNYVKGFDVDSEVGFLADLRGLRRLTVVIPGTVDLAPIASCLDLERLHLDFAEAREPVSLAGLGRLRDLALESPAAITDLYELTGLTKLLIGRYPETSLKPLHRLRGLRTLTLYEADKLVTLDGIEHLTALSEIELAGARKLSDIDALAGAPALTKLDITGAAGVRDWSRLGELANLRRLSLEEVKTIESLDFVHRLKVLRKLYVVGAKVSDDSVMRLRPHPSLRKISLPP